MIRKLWQILVVERRLPGVVSTRLVKLKKCCSKVVLGIDNRLYRVRYAFGIPVPPPPLLHLVVSGTNVKGFLNGGRQGVADIAHVLKRNHAELNDCRNVLDFGCGCGRVIRWMKQTGSQLHGTDYNEELISWCKKNIKFASFGVNRLKPPLPYQDDQFDLIYSYSVFTHLSEELQFAWLDELNRILKPGGYLFVTVHGERFVDRLPEDERARLQNGQTVVLQEGASGRNHCAAFHTEDYIRRNWCRGFTILDFEAERGIACGKQDACLLQKQ